MPDQPSHLPERERQPSDHDGHDRYLIAAFATDDLTGAELTDATALVARCQDCAALLADLRSIASATAELPVPARTRDFRLSEEDARRLRPGGWRQVVGFLAGPRLAFAKPLATALTTIGLAGRVELLLVSRGRPTAHRGPVDSGDRSRSGPLRDPLGSSPPRNLTLSSPKADAIWQGADGTLERPNVRIPEACPWNA